jgi:opacity protein-like surface antigen
MSWRSGPEAWTLALLLAALITPRSAAAQGWREFQLWGVALASDPAVYGGGLGIGWRDAQRTRITLAVAGGTTDDSRAAGRAELTWNFLLDPAKRSGFSVYGGGGLALGLVENESITPWVQATIGLETSPAAKSSFFVEAGFGGGVRGAIGLRFRSRRTPRRPG